MTEQDRGSRIEDQGLRIEDQGLGIEDQGLGTKDQGLGTKDRGGRIQDSSMGDKELHRISDPQSSILNPGTMELHQVPHPQSLILDPVSMERVRWRCRRGLLELDIVLGRFIELYASLDSQQKVVFDELLDLPDTELWDMISGKLPALHDDQNALLALINKA